MMPDPIVSRGVSPSPSESICKIWKCRQGVQGFLAIANMAEQSITLSHMRSDGCRDLLINGVAGPCHHRARMNADTLPDGYRCSSWAQAWSATVWAHGCRCAAGAL